MTVNYIHINNIYIIKINNIYYSFIILYNLIGQGGFCYWHKLQRYTNMMPAVSEKDGKICKILLKKM